MLPTALEDQEIMAIEDHHRAINNGDRSSAGLLSDINVSLNTLFDCQPARCVSRVYTPRDTGCTLYAHCRGICKAHRRAVEGLDMLDAAGFCGVDNAVPLSW